MLTGLPLQLQLKKKLLGYTGSLCSSTGEVPQNCRKKLIILPSYQGWNSIQLVQLAHILHKEKTKHQIAR